MAGDYDDNNSGVLFKNDNKTAEKHPDYKGSAEVNGVEYWVAAWVKVPKKGGAKFMSLSYESKEEAATKSGKAKSGNANKVSVPSDDDIPF